jgi:hypothetical protein
MYAIIIIIVIVVVVIIVYVHMRHLCKFISFPPLARSCLIQFSHLLLCIR